jgi:hypothetical protein
MRPRRPVHAGASLRNVSEDWSRWRIYAREFARHERRFSCGGQSTRPRTFDNRFIEPDHARNVRGAAGDSESGRMCRSV